MFVKIKYLDCVELIAEKEKYAYASGTVNAKTALSKYIHAISEYNRSLTETANPESDDDIETIIAE